MSTTPTSSPPLSSRHWLLDEKKIEGEGKYLSSVGELPFCLDLEFGGSA